jgi:two-component system, LuxR family, response regulator FixJ
MSASETEPTVYVVEDDSVSRALVLALANSVGLMCKPFADAHEFLEHYDANQPGCLVLDVFMPGMSGRELQNELNRRGAVIPVIFVTGNATIVDSVAAMRQGAFNYLVKPIHYTDLLESVRSAVEHDRRNRQILAQMDSIRQRMQSLTHREREVLECIARGCANKVMAQEMGLSRRTIELHRSRVMEKMGAGSIAQLVRMFINFEQSRFS